MPCLLSADEAASAKEYKRAEEGHGRDAYVHTNTLDWSENKSFTLDGEKKKKKPLQAVIDGGP